MTTNENSMYVNEKRIKKTVDRLSDAYEKGQESNRERNSIVSNGSGVKLGDIERVKDAYHRAKIDKQITKVIYLLCFKSPGQALKRNSKIKQFNGFDKDDQNEFDKRKILCEKVRLESLKIICDLFNVPVTGKQKKDICLALIEFLKCPRETGSKKFRSSALRPRQKGKLRKSATKVVRGKKERVSEDVEVATVSDCTEISLSGSSSEELIVSNTKILENRDANEGLCEVKQTVTPKNKLEDKTADDGNKGRENNIDIDHIKDVENNKGDKYMTNETIMTSKPKANNLNYKLSKIEMVVDNIKKFKAINAGLKERAVESFPGMVAKSKEIEGVDVGDLEISKHDVVSTEKERSSGLNLNVKEKKKHIIKIDEGTQNMDVRDGGKSRDIKLEIDKIAEQILKRKKLTLKKERFKIKISEHDYLSKEMNVARDDIASRESTTNVQTTRDEDRRSVSVTDDGQGAEPSSCVRTIVAMKSKAKRESQKQGCVDSVSGVVKKRKVGGNEGECADLSDENVKCTILAILREADLNTTTLNQVCDKVIALFPGSGIGHPRSRIKNLVKEVIDEN